MTNIVNEALRLASLGYPVFPVKAGDKKPPLTPHGLDDATLDMQQIEDWWSRHPRANIGIATEGLLVLDIDPGGEAYTAGKPMGDPPEVITPRGGRHYYYRRPEGVAWKGGAGKLAKGVDIRTDGNYAVASPSQVNGKPYEWLQPLEAAPEHLPPPPEWLRRDLDAAYPAAKPRTNGTHRALANGHSVLERARKYLAKVPAAVSGQGGHNDTFYAACQVVRGFDLGPDEAMTLMREWNAGCQPPWTEAELLHKVTDAAKEESERGYLLNAGRNPIESTPRPRVELRRETPIIRRMADVTPQKVEWLWKGRIAIGKVTLLAGDPGLGKSFMTCDFAGRVSSGRGWPDAFHEGQPAGDVILMNAEDDVEDTIRPRLDKACADVSRVITIEGIRVIDPETGKSRVDPMALDAHLHILDETLAGLPGCRLVVVDPLSAFCGKTDSHNDAAVRRMLAPLAKLAATHRVAILGVTHWNKGGNTKSTYRAMGSLAFVAAARAVWCVTPDLDQPDRRLMLPVKNNLSKRSAGLAFSIIDDCVAWEANPVDTTADAHFATEAKRAQTRETDEDRVEVSDWLRGYLADGAKPSKDCLADGKEMGFTPGKLRRALEKIGGRAEKEGMTGPWLWHPGSGGTF